MRAVLTPIGFRTFSSVRVPQGSAVQRNNQAKIACAISLDSRLHNTRPWNGADVFEEIVLVQPFFADAVIIPNTFLIAIVDKNNDK